MTETISIRAATAADFQPICALLETSKLPTIDLNPSLPSFFIAEQAGKVAGVMGMDRYEKFGLLRSAATAAEYRNLGIAGALVEKVEQAARSQQLTSLYLITNTAEAWFARKGFTKIDRSEVPAVVLQSEEFNGLCPSSSTIMAKPLAR